MIMHRKKLVNGKHTLGRADSATSDVNCDYIRRKSVYPDLSHVINFPGPRLLNPYCKQQEAGWGLETSLA